MNAGPELPLTRVPPADNLTPAAAIGHGPLLINILRSTSNCFDRVRWPTKRRSHSAGVRWVEGEPRRLVRRSCAGWRHDRDCLRKSDGERCPEVDSKLNNENATIIVPVNDVRASSRKIHVVYLEVCFFRAKPTLTSPPFRMAGAQQTVLP